jgi:hypothetical protein
VRDVRIARATEHDDERFRASIPAVISEGVLHGLQHNNGLPTRATPGRDHDNVR